MDDFTFSANQLGCTDVPDLIVTWSKTSVLGVKLSEYMHEQMTKDVAVEYALLRCSGNAVAQKKDEKK